VFDDAWARIAYELARGAFAEGTFADHVQLCVDTEAYWIKNACPGMYYVALAAALRAGDRNLCSSLAANFRAADPKQRGWVNSRLTFGRLGAGGTPLDELVSELHPPDAADLERGAIDRHAQGDHVGSLALAERAAKLGKPGATLVANAIGIAVHAYPKKLPREVLDRWMKRAPEKGLAGGYWENVACAQVRLGDLDEAMSSLEKAVELGFDRDAIATDEVLAPLRKRADFKALIAKPNKPAKRA
jgi:hypothetical protein